MRVAYIALFLCCRVNAQLDVVDHVIYSLAGQELVDDFDTPGDAKYWDSWNKAEESQHWYQSFTGDPNPFGRQGSRPPPIGLHDGFLEVVPIKDVSHSGDPAHLHSKYMKLEPGSSLEILYWATVPTLATPFDLVQLDVQLYGKGHSHVYQFPKPVPNENQWRSVIIPLNINNTSTVQVTRVLT